MLRNLEMERYYFWTVINLSVMGKSEMEGHTGYALHAGKYLLL